MYMHIFLTICIALVIIHYYGLYVANLKSEIYNHMLLTKKDETFKHSMIDGKYVSLLMCP